MKFTNIKNTMFFPVLLALACIVVAQISAADSATGQQAPDIDSPVWLNEPPQRMADLRGKVVLVEFWTYSCSNCRNVEPYIMV